MSQDDFSAYHSAFYPDQSAGAQEPQYALPGTQDYGYPLASPFDLGQAFVEREYLGPFDIPAHIPQDHIEGTIGAWGDEDAEGERDGEQEGEEEGEDYQSESSVSETGSRQSTPATTIHNPFLWIAVPATAIHNPFLWTAVPATAIHNNFLLTAIPATAIHNHFHLTAAPAATPTTPDYESTEWAYDPTLKLETLEGLRGCFRSELSDPSAWTLQRITVLTRTVDPSEPRRIVKSWYDYVAESTDTPAGEPLRLPQVTRPGDTPFQRTWEEAEQLDGQARDLCFGRDGLDFHKNFARRSIEFLIPDARTRGLSADNRKRLFTAALSVWTIEPSKAKGLLWVMENEYPHTHEKGGREWANSRSEEFMVYTVLYPPPIVLIR